MFSFIWRIWRFLPLLLALVALLRRGKKDDELSDGDRSSLSDDIEALTTLAESGEADERKRIARETAERLRAALARQQVNQGALRSYKKHRAALGETIPANAATDKRYDSKLRDLQQAAGKLAGNG
jgi:hypothetical protein